MERKEYPPEYPPSGDTSELTRQVEMLMQGLSVADPPQTEAADNEPRVKRRTLDDMRRLSEHIKNIPVYRANSPTAKRRG